MPPAVQPLCQFHEQRLNDFDINETISTIDSFDRNKIIDNQMAKFATVSRFYKKYMNGSKSANPRLIRRKIDAILEQFGLYLPINILHLDCLFANIGTDTDVLDVLINCMNEKLLLYGVKFVIRLF